ncbi:hypothetical protein EW145_g7367 [Phellinidium pouzarii]|uniref:Uncharacterized protein n=1 Tax=Phellinidium pouzarii TaxID=167371 RepID=A0A4S4KK41_9AGAM|nr:hypothetical protein EW145_g7367 [Phellinidium pouzarii]
MHTADSGCVPSITTAILREQTKNLPCIRLRVNSHNTLILKGAQFAAVAADICIPPGEISFVTSLCSDEDP